MIGDSTATKAGSGKFKGALEIPGVPTRVKGDLVPGGIFRGDLGPAIDLHFKAAGLKEKGGTLDPLVSQAIGVVLFLNRTEIEKSASGEFRFLHLHSVLDHAADDAGGGAVQAGDHDEVVGKEGGEGPDPFIGEVGIGDEAVQGEALDG